MYRKSLFPILALITILVMVSLACGTSGNTPQATATQKGPQATNTQEKGAATNTPKPSKPSDTPVPENPLLVTSVDDAEKAVIQVLAEGSITDPQNGVVTEGLAGSGFVIDPSGIAITNNHVVTGAARIKVYFTDHAKAYNAQILGRSECSDLAVIKIEGDKFPYLSWYTDDIKLGLEVYALGYPQGTTSFTRNKGEISKRPFAQSISRTSVNSVVESSAITNPGSSGGPLVTADGKVVGVTYAGDPTNSRYYAITYSEAQPILDKLKNGENVTSMGINGEAFVLDANTSGIWVYSVASGSPADKAGLKGGDIITSVENTRVGKQGTMLEYCDILRSHSEKDTLSITVYRYPTQEFLEGQFNGRELVVTQQGQGGGGATSTVVAGGEATPQPYFTEHFDIPKAPNWTYKVFGGATSDVNVYTDNSMIVFEDNGKSYRMAILFYDPYYYNDVAVDTSVKNLGTNNYYLGLVTRYKDGEGFYLFLINPGGYYGIWRYDWSSGNYAQLRTGASTAVKPGKDTNRLTAITKGTTLSLFVNDTFIYSVEDSTLDQGKIGIGIYALETFPVKAEFDYVTIAQP